MHVVLGLHKVLPEHLDEYLSNVKRHAENSAGEPGCVRYEVLQDADNPTTVCLFEVFHDETALDVHHAAPHYQWWIDISARWRKWEEMQRHVMHFVTPDPK